MNWTLELIVFIIFSITFVFFLPRLCFLIFLNIAHIYRRIYGDPASKILPFKAFALFPFFWHESTALLQISKWNLLTNKKQELKDRINDPQKGKTILFIHGYSQDHSNFFKMRSEIDARLMRPTSVVFLGKRGRSTHLYASALEKKIESLILSKKSIDIVCHSMGGIILRVVLQMRPDLRSGINKVITLGTPHYGTASARHFAIGEEVIELRQDSKTLQNLEHLTAMLDLDRVVAVSAPQDYVVYPESTCYPPNIKHTYRLTTCGHGGLLVHEESIQLVSELLT